MKIYLMILKYKIRRLKKMFGESPSHFHDDVISLKEHSQYVSTIIKKINKINLKINKL